MFSAMLIMLFSSSEIKVIIDQFLIANGWKVVKKTSTVFAMARQVMSQIRKITLAFADQVSKCNCKSAQTTQTQSKTALKALSGHSRRNQGPEGLSRSKSESGLQN